MNGKAGTATSFDYEASKMGSSIATPYVSTGVGALTGSDTDADGTMADAPLFKGLAGTEDASASSLDVRK